MSVLYRKYRPQSFSEIQSQPQVTITLRNALKRNQLGQAYLFVGPRGTGKTSVARILAKALNCLQRDKKEGEPCNHCFACQAIVRGQFLDLIEIDAASNRGIDDIRALREKVNFNPVQGEYKVYVLDEVHMLTKEAFNALLKTLEEPPAHVVFVLCTTEVHRVPLTIISRCQRFDFRLASLEDIIKFLQNIAEKEKLKIESAALKIIADQARGSFRDALTLLEQVSAFEEQEITSELVRQNLGLLLENEGEKILQFLQEGNLEKSLLIINQLAEEGKDIPFLINLLLKLIRNRLQENLRKGKKDLGMIRFWVRLSFYLQQAARETAQAVISQLPLELALWHFLLEMRSGRDSSLSGQFSNGGAKKQELGKILRVPKNSPSPPSSSGKDSQKIRRKSLNSDDLWEEIMIKIKPYNHSLHALLKACRLERIEGEVLHLGFFYKFHKERIAEDKNRRLVEKVASEVLGKNVRINCYLLEKPVEQTPPVLPKAAPVSVSRALPNQEMVVKDQELSEADLIRITQEILGGEIEN